MKSEKGSPVPPPMTGVPNPWSPVNLVRRILAGGCLVLSLYFGALVAAMIFEWHGFLAGAAFGLGVGGLRGRLSRRARLTCGIVALILGSLFIIGYYTGPVDGRNDEYFETRNSSGIGTALITLPALICASFYVALEVASCIRRTVAAEEPDDASELNSKG